MAQESSFSFESSIAPPSDESISKSAKELQKELAPRVSADVPEEKDMPVLDLMGKIKEEDFFADNIVRGINREVFEVDPDFVPTSDMYQQAMKTHGISPEYLDELDDSVSYEDWAARVEHIKEEQDLNTELGEYGWKGAGLRFATNVLDPSMWGLALASGPIAFGSKAIQMGRVARISRLAGLSVAETAILEAGVQTDKITWGFEDSAATVLTAGILTAGVARAIDGPIQKQADEYSKAAVLENAEQLGIRLSDEAKARLAPGKVEIDDPELLKTAPAAMAGTVAAPDVFFKGKAGIRYDMMARVKTSASTAVQKYFSRLGQDVVPDVRGGEVNKISATELATRLHRTSRAVFSNIVQQRNKFADAENVGRFRNPIKRGEIYSNFYQLVEKAVARDGDDYIDVELAGLLPEQRASLKAARDAYRASTKQVLQDLKDAGVEAADDIDFNKFYVPRRIKSTVIEKWSRDLSEDVLIDAVANAYLKGTKSPLTPLEARKLAKSYVLGIKRVADDNIVNFGQVSARNIDELEYYLRNKGIDESVLADTRAILEKKQKAGSNLSGRGQTVTKGDAEFRADIDELYEEVITLPNGQKYTFRMEDLFERNAMLYDQYLQQMSGRVAAARVLGIRSDKDYRDRLVEIGDEIKTLSSKDQVSAKADLDRVDIMYRHLMGKSLRESETNQDINFATRLLMGYNYTLYMGQVGFAQVAEIGNIAALQGIRAMFRQMPGLRALKRDLETGEIKDDQLLRELEAITGIGAEFHRFSTYSERYTGTAGEVLGQQFGPMQQRVLKGLEYLKQGTSLVSGMTPITIWMQRTAAKAGVQNILDRAKRGFTDEDYLDFAELGLSKKQADALGDQLKKAKVNERGVIQSVGLDRWDPQLREDFANALSRWTYRVIQENDIGAMGMFMTSNIGKILTQFRTFMLVAHGKQFLHMAHRRNASLFGAFFTTSFLGALAYMAQTGIKGMVSDDLFGEDGKWEIENIAKAAFQRSAYSSLIPAIADTGFEVFGLDPQFSYGRSTGLATGFIEGAPAMQSLGRLEHFLGLPGVINPYSDREAEWEKYYKSIPFNNAIGVWNLGKWAFGDD